MAKKKSLRFVSPCNQRRMFLPAHLHQVRAIAARGMTEPDICEFLDIHPKQIKLWKKQYPLFEQALEDGWTDADAKVLEALYKLAVGYSHEAEELFHYRGEVIRADYIKHYPPDIAAIKFWLTNRQKEHWKNHPQLTVSPGGNAPIGFRNETRKELMSSILALLNDSIHP